MLLFYDLLFFSDPHDGYNNLLFQQKKKKILPEFLQNIAKVLVLILQTMIPLYANKNETI